MQASDTNKFRIFFYSGTFLLTLTWDSGITRCLC
jgi:hypothetical protein